MAVLVYCASPIQVSDAQSTLQCHYYVHRTPSGTMYLFESLLLSIWFGSWGLLDDGGGGGGSTISDPLSSPSLRDPKNSANVCDLFP